MKNTLENSGFLNGSVPSAGSSPDPGTSKEAKLNQRRLKSII
ncbi:MAG: hypothetical protein PHI28_19625 [Mangrovibacterium sp.]|nr:hypothetical protein [Mangrovibacterium sp.]